MRAPWLLVLVLLLAAPVLPAAAVPGGLLPPDRGRPQALAGDLTLDQAVKRAEKRYQARAVKAEERREGDRLVYHIRLLSDDGRVFDVTVDAATGRME
jgi:uncharacterized iron-regulated membrane protein